MRLSRNRRDGLCGLRLSRNRRGGWEKLAVGAVAASFEATDDAAEVFVHFLLDEDDAVEMVGHHLEGDDLDLGIVVGDAPPFIIDTLAEWREFHSGGVGTVRWCLTLTHNPAEDGKAAFGHHRHHVHLTDGVVVTYTAALHGGFLLACECLLAFIYFTFHGTNIQSSSETGKDWAEK